MTQNQQEHRETVKKSYVASTPALEVARCIDYLGIAPSRIAFRLGVRPETMGRWQNQAILDGGMKAAGGLVPTDAHVQALRMMCVIKRTCPAMLSSLQIGFWEDIGSIIGEPLRMVYQPTQTDLRGLVVDGADVGEDE